MFNKIFFICLLLAITKSNCIELENICDTFKHDLNGVTHIVNSVHKMKFDLSIEKISSFLIDEDINYENIFPENNQAVQTLNYIRIKNKKIVDEVYNENFLNSPEKIRKIHLYTTEVMNNLREAQELTIYADHSKWPEFRLHTIKKLKNTDNFVFLILLLQGNRLTSTDEKNLELFKNLILNLKKSIKPDQKFVFENETPNYIHKKVNIFSFTKFMKHNSDQSTSTLTIHVYLPFNNSKYVKSPNCLAIKNLPQFYDINYK